MESIAHIAIICSDYKKSKVFYSELLELKIVSELFRAENNSYKLNLETKSGIQIELFSFLSSPARPSYPEACGLRHLAFSCSDIFKTITELEAKGIVFEAIRTDEQTGKLFTFFSDPDGLPLELYQS